MDDREVTEADREVTRASLVSSAPPFRRPVKPRKACKPRSAATSRRTQRSAAWSECLSPVRGARGASARCTIDRRRSLQFVQHPKIRHRDDRRCEHHSVRSNNKRITSASPTVGRPHTPAECDYMRSAHSICNDSRNSKRPHTSIGFVKRDAGGLGRGTPKDALFPILHQLNTPPIMLQRQPRMILLRLRGRETPIGRVPCRPQDSLLVLRAATKTHVGKKQPGRMTLPAQFSFEREAVLVPVHMERHLKVAHILSGQAVWVRSTPHSPTMMTPQGNDTGNKVSTLSGQSPPFPRGISNNTAEASSFYGSSLFADPLADLLRSDCEAATSLQPQSSTQSANSIDERTNRHRKRRQRDEMAARAKQRSDEVFFAGWWNEYNPILTGPANVIARMIKAKQVNFPQRKACSDNL